MAFLDNIFGKRKKTIGSISLDDLTMAKVKLEQEQERVMRRVSDLEKEKEKLFQQGVNEPPSGASSSWPRRSRSWSSRPRATTRTWGPTRSRCACSTA